MIYVIALLVLIGAFYWYGARFDNTAAAPDGAED
jgi:hypothetical protein